MLISIFYKDYFAYMLIKKYKLKVLNKTEAR